MNEETAEKAVVAETQGSNPPVSATTNKEFAFKLLGVPGAVIANCLEAFRDILSPLEELNRMILLVLLFAGLGFGLIPTPQ